MTVASERLARVEPALAETHTLVDDEFASVAAGVARLGWPEGFNQVLETLTPARTRQLQRELWARHAGWKGLFPAAHRRLALVYEGGYGSVSAALAEDFEAVVALVPDVSHARVVRARVAWLRIQNLTVLVRGESIPHTTPADAIVVHGFDPSTTWALVDETLRRHHRGAQTAMFVGLQAGGRAGAAAVSRIRRRLDREFAVVDQFAFDSGLVDSSELISTRGESLRRGLVARLAPWRDRGVGLVARPAAERTLFEAVTNAVSGHCAQHWNMPVRFHITRRLFSTPEGFTLMLQSQGAPAALVVRIAMNDRTAARFRTNYDSLCLLAGDGAPRDTPVPLLAGHINGHAYFAESMLPGTALRAHLGTASESAATRAAVGWITELHTGTAVPRPLSAADLSKLVVEPVAEAFRFIGRNPDDEGCRSLQSGLLKAFDGQIVPLVMSHGDYSVDNVLVDPTGAAVSAVFDWDLAARQGLPLLDVLYLLLSRNAARHRLPFAEHAAGLLTGTALSATDRLAIQGYCDALHIPEQLRVPLIVMTWVNHLARRIRSAEPYRWPGHDREFGRAFLEAVNG
jgi:aminoglycoside phosphotransferase (APT) family kinase protein